MRPGPLNPHDARDAAAFARQTEADRRAIERRVPRWRDHLPAKLTSTDGAGRFGWTEQAFDATGQRYDKPAGRFGAPDYRPAYAVGDGTGPLPTALHVQTWLRRVLETSERGTVYEFDWQCACVGGYSGSGSGSGSPTVTTQCCGGVPIRTTLYATWVQTLGSGGCLNGWVVPITFIPLSLTWDGLALLPTACGRAAGTMGGVRLNCAPLPADPFNYTWYLSADGGGGTPGGVPPGNTSISFSTNEVDAVTCSPYSATFDTPRIGPSGFPGGYKVVVTE